MTGSDTNFDLARADDARQRQEDIQLLTTVVFEIQTVISQYNKDSSWNGDIRDLPNEIRNILTRLSLSSPQSPPVTIPPTPCSSVVQQLTDLHDGRFDTSCS